MKLTIEIRLLPRIKPAGMDNYKKVPKMPRRIRTDDDDHLNTYKCPVGKEYLQDLDALSVWGQEISRLKELVPWKIQQNPDYGDMLIGCISTSEWDDFYINLYLPVRPIK